MTKIIAHRGYSGKYPENTLLSLQKAQEVGADSVELDAQITKDGVLVVHHMYYLGTSNNGEGIILEKSYEELKKLDAGSWFDKKYKELKIPTLDDVFKLLKDDIGYELELKGFTKEYLQKVIDLVNSHGLLEKIEFTSPNPYALTALKKMVPEATIGMFSIPVPDWMDKELGQEINLNNAVLGQFDVLHCPLALIDDPFINKLHKHNIKIHVADCNTQEELNQAFSYPVDQLSTNELETALKLRKNEG